MAKKKNKKKEVSLTLLERLRKKDRLVVVDLKTYEEIRHFNFSALSLIIYTVFAVFIVSYITWLLIAHTPIKQNIPGYPNIANQKKLAFLDKRNIGWIESKKEKLNQEHIYYRNLALILSDSIINSESEITNVKIDSTRYRNPNFSISKRDSILRLKVEEQEKYLITSFQQEEKPYNDLKGVLFFPPINGTVSDSINVRKGHYGIDIIAPKDEAVKSTLRGTVIYTDWTPDNGNVIHVQHNYNLVSVYKHNAVLLKKVGDIVRAGEPIAIIGNSGRLSSGPHLHLELWHKGMPLNPLDYIIF